MHIVPLSHLECLEKMLGTSRKIKGTSAKSAKRLLMIKYRTS